MDYPSGITADDLPELIADFVEQLGFDAAMLIVEKYKAKHLSIPIKKLPPDLVHNLGEDLAQSIINIYGGCQWLIPTCKKLSVKLRNRDIVTHYKKLCEDGVSHTNAILQCARNWDLAYSQTHGIVKEPKDD
jgi:hypothetical protein